ncbi:MAG: cyclic nucleotide-binding domain-containing protein [Elusimicrobia bacterium]|nr:cyclic nucleotide-binding domain-containing protein [Elusimicrobiota bacterium]
MKPEEVPSWEPFLKRIALFAGLSPEDLGKIAARLQPLSLPKGATLFREGDDPDAMYLIVSGQGRRLRTMDGRETVVAFLGRGEVAGETGLLTGIPRTSTVRLDSTSELLKLPRKGFEEMLREHPSILLGLSRTLAQRLITQGAGPTRPGSDSRLIVLDPALPRPDRAAFAWALGAELALQTRKRVLLVDLSPEPGAVARAGGLSPIVVGEPELRAANLRDPAALSGLSQEHPSGLRVLSVPPAALGGRMFGSLYLFLNSLRGGHDFALVCLPGGGRGDVERAALAEADRVLMAGCDEMRPQFRQMEAEVPALVPEPARVLRLWLGELEPEDAPLLIGAERALIPWGPELAAAPKAGAAVARLARRLGGVRVGLALGSGAALGHATIGVLKVFKREGIPVDVAAGTSMGAVIAACAAAGYEPEEIEQMALRIDKAWVYENLFWDLTVPRSGFFAGETLLRFLRSYFGSREFSDLEIPFACVAADIETGEEVVLKSGRVAEAVRASASLPIIFAPLLHDGRYLVDGGLVNPVPTRVLTDLGADILIAVNLSAPAGDRPRHGHATARKPLLDSPVSLKTLREAAIPALLKAPSLFDVFFQMIYTMEYEVSHSRLEIADVVLHPDLKGFSWTELNRAKEIIAAGERAAEEALPRIRALIPSLRPGS